MGLLDDISMGLGLKDRDDDYYERTAQTIGRTQRAGNEARYRSRTGLDRGQTVGSSGMPSRGGLLSFLGAGSGGGSGSAPSANQSASDRSFLAQLFGYRDTADMFDRGGPYASGGMYQGAGTYSLLANLGHALSGQEFGERTPYEKVQAQAAIKSTNGAIPEATRNALSSIRPPARPDGLTPVAQPAMVNPMAEGYKGAATPMGPEDFAPYPAANNMPPIAQAATGLTIPSPPPTAGVSAGQPSFEEFVAMQKQMEAQMGMQPMSEQEYINMYQTQMQRMN